MAIQAYLESVSAAMPQYDNDVDVTASADLQTDVGSNHDGHHDDDHRYTDKTNIGVM